MKHLKIALLAATFALGASSAMAQDKPDMSHAPAVTKYAKEFVATWSNDPALLEAIEASTKKHAAMNYDEILAQDKAWKDKKPIVEEIRGNKTSAFLKEQMAKAPNGAVTEIFVMDGQGWNVGQTGGTSDFYQGDEGKWQKTYAAGADGIEVLPIEDDGGVKVSQVSLPIMKGDRAVGAVTVGIDTSKVK